MRYLLFILISIISASLTDCGQTLPDKYNNYKCLSKAPLKSENYELIKIMDSWKGEAQSDGVITLKEILYDKSTKLLLLISEYVSPSEEYNILLKVDSRGRVIDSIRVDVSSMLYNSGAYFENDYFIDWINNGNKEKQKYSEIIYEDSISPEQFKSYMTQASMIDIGRDYENKLVNIFLNIQGGWTMIKSKKIYEQIENEEPLIGVVFSIKVKPYSNNYSERFIKLEDAIKPFQKWDDTSNFIHIEQFVKVTRQSPSFFSLGINGPSENGWSGIGYFKLIHNSEVFNFKAYTFKYKKDDDGFNPEISVFFPIESDQDLVFVNLYKYNDRLPISSGVYILRKK